jgi:hypothetical protein
MALMALIDITHGPVQQSFPSTLIETIRFCPSMGWLFPYLHTVELLTVTGRVYRWRFRRRDAAEIFYAQLKVQWDAACQPKVEES